MDSDTSAEPPAHSLHGALRSGVRTVTAIIGLVVAVMVASVAVTEAVVTPRLDTLNQDLAQVRDSNVDVLLAESAVRAWAATGDASHLAPLGDDVEARLGELVPPEVRAHGQAGDEAGRAYDRWLGRWALPVLARGGTGPIHEGTLSELFHQERALIDDYRAAQEVLVQDLRDRRDQLFAIERAVQVSGVVVSLLLVAVMLIVQRRQRARFERLADPIDELLATMERVRAGDLASRPDPARISELQPLGDGLTELIDSLRRAEDEVRVRERQLRSNLARQATVLRMEQEIAGSDDADHVVEVAVRATAAVTGASQVALWLTDDQRVSLRKVAAFDPDHGARLTNGSHGDESVPFGKGALGQALIEGQPISVTHPGGQRCWMWPLQTTSHTVGVLELTQGPVDIDDDLVDAVTTLALHAASAVVAARLYSDNAQMARQDGLTGLRNRRSFDADLEREVSHARRHDRPLSLIMIDLDHFKLVNDTHGHPFGDEVLRRTAATVQTSLREEDLAYRVGGEELAVVCRDTDRDGATLVAERIRARVERMLSAEAGDPLTVTASVGVSTSMTHGHQAARLVAAADAALYAAKRAGRNQVVVAA